MMNTQELLQDLNRRYATKEFDSTKLLDQSQLQELMEAARLSPSSYGLQPWKFIVVQNALIREQLLSHSYNQRQVVDASHLVVLCIKKDFGKEDIDRYIQDMSKKRNMPKESLLGYRDVMIQTLSGMSAEQRTGWMQKQVYLALGFLLAQAAHMHIDACPMEGFVPEEFDRVLDLGEYQSVVICPIGYRSQDDKYAEVEKVRYSSEEVIEWR